MILGIYSVFDKKVKVYSAPAVMANDDVAIRVIKQEVEKETSFGQFPFDKQLWRVGDFNTETGILDRLQANELVCEFAQFIKKGKNEDKS